MAKNTQKNQNDKQLRYGWTTGACATAATAAAYSMILTDSADNPIQITLPKGETHKFPLEFVKSGADWAEVGIIKDAGDDPDVTHGALIIARVNLGAKGSGIAFKSGEGVGTVTRPGLPTPVGEPAINPVPRAMMSSAVKEIAEKNGVYCDVTIEISIPGGEKLAEKTLNARLGVLGGLSILGTTGIVRPFSCASWIASIHRGIDVARAAGLKHVAGTTGNTSETAVRKKYDLSEQALLDMGDFAGGLLKYLRRHPIPKLTIAGGPGKITKLAQGHLDLHSSRSSVDFKFLIELLEQIGAADRVIAKIDTANTAKQVFDIAMNEKLPLPDTVSDSARTVVGSVLRDAPVEVNVLIVDRNGIVIGQSRG